MRRLLFLLVLVTGCATPGAAPPVATPAGVPAVVELPSTLDVALFFGEREMLRRAVADHLRRSSKLNLAPLPDLEEQVIRATAAKSKETCAYPTSEDTVLTARHPDALHVSVHASCHDGVCTLRAVVRRPSSSNRATETLERWTAPVTDPGTAQGWVNAVGSLALAPEPPGGGMDLLGRVDEGGHPVDVVGIGSAQPFTPALTQDVLTPVRKAMDACHVPGWTSAGTDHLAVELAPAGTVARCEGAPHKEGEGPQRMACLCKALVGLKLPPGPRGRRFEVRVLNRPQGGPKLPTGAWASLERANRAPGFDPRPALGEHARALAACAAAAGGPVDLEVQVDLQVDGRGQASGATARAEGAPAGLLACVQAELAQAALPCPPEGAPQTVSATYRLRAKGAGR